MIFSTEQLQSEVLSSVTLRLTEI